MDIYKEELKQCVKEIRHLSCPMQSLFNIIWGQYSQLMQHTLHAISYLKIKNDADTVSLLKEIRPINMQLKHTCQSMMAFLKPKGISSFKSSTKKKATTSHLRTSKTLVDSVKFFGGSIMYNPGLLKYEQSIYKSYTSEDKLGVKITNKMKAVGLIKLSDRKRYGRLIQVLKDHHTFGNNLYPATINSTFEMLQNHSSGKWNGKSQNLSM